MAGPRSSPLLLCLLVASTLLLDLGVAAPAPGDIVYDQRQSGTYNVHVRVQDVGIFAVLGRSSNSESSQDDVYEDYHDPVENDEDPSCCKGISPANNTTEANSTSTTTSGTISTTTSSTTSTTTPSTTTSSTTSTTTPSTTTSSTTSTTTPSTTTPSTTTSSTTTPTTTTSTTTTVTTPVPSTTKKRKKTSTVAVANSTSTTTTAPTRRRRCHFGYVRDKSGRCRRVQRVAESTFGLRLVPRTTATPPQKR